MKNKKKQGGCGTYLIIWIIASLLVGMCLNSVNETGQGNETIILFAILLGGLFTFVIFCIMMVIVTSQAKKEKKNPSVSNAQVVNNSAAPAKEQPKCNCDGCPRQESCEYGHIIVDEITGERLTLADKFILKHAFDDYEPDGDEYTDIATIEERHHQKKLLPMEDAKLLRTLEYLDKQKKLYYEVGKCGQAYYRFMNMGEERKLVWETIQLKRKKGT